MKLEPVSPSVVWQIAMNMRVRDRREFEAVYGAISPTEMANALAHKYGGRPDCFIVADDQAGEVAVAGFCELRPHVTTLMMFGTDDFSRVGWAFTKRIRSMIADMEWVGVHRFECITLAGYERMHDWLELIGLRAEGMHHKWGVNGEDFISYAKVT